MPEGPSAETRLEERGVYAKPRLRDYGEVTDVTALNAAGFRTDALIPAGQIVTFQLS